MNRFLVELRIALFQLNPQIGQLEQNIVRTLALVEKLKKKAPNRSPDVVVFPEFALTGYSFRSKDEIMEYTCKMNEGPSFQLAQKVSKTFNCYTVIGYPEKFTDHNNALKLYNSAVVVDPQGNLVFNYRKSFLYDTEENWDCEENPNGFETFPLTFKQKAKPIGIPDAKPCDITLKTAIGICMDLSPYKFEAPFNDFEFATFNIDKKTDLILCPMAWLHSTSITKYDGYSSEEREIKLKEIKRNLESQGLSMRGSNSDDKFQIDIDNNNTTSAEHRNSGLINQEYKCLDEPDLSNLNYWILRFLPFLSLGVRKHWFQEGLIKKYINSDPSYKSKSYMGASEQKHWEFEGRNVVLANANRCGVECGNTIFAGSSGIYKFNGKDNITEMNMDSTNESVELLGNLGKGLEGVIMRDVQLTIQQ